jgi:hypothetical protein
MANNNKPKGKGVPAKNRQHPPSYKPIPQALSLFENLNNWFNKREKNITLIIFICSGLFSVLLFQARMDIGGDDSGYLERAYDFIHKGIFPSYQGPLYPIVLSIFMIPFGINIIILKILSLLFNIVGLYFFYRAFKDRIPAMVFYPVFFITGINSFILNYASLTYSEAIFMCLQYMFFFYFFRLIDNVEDTDAIPAKENYKYWLIPGLLVFLMAITKNVAIISMGAIVLYFILNKQYRSILYMFGAFLVFEIPLLILQKVFLKTQNQWGAQGNILMLKDPYDASKGNETLPGFFTRFFQNCDDYISKRFFEIVGLRSDESVRNYKPMESDNLNWFVIFIVALCAFMLYRIVKSKNKYMVVTFLYAISIMVASFFVLQTRWDQPRIIMICVPILLMTLFYGLYDLFKKAAWGFQFILFMVIIVFAIAGATATLGKAKKNLPVIGKNLHGDILYGYTPDWINYLKMSRWCADSLPKDAKVAVRKSSMSFIYANGKEFFPVYRVYSTNADSLLNYFKINKVNYVMLPSLRINPDKNTGDVITTMQFMLSPIYKKYPQRLKFIHREGAEEFADLYQILY